MCELDWKQEFHKNIMITWKIEGGIIVKSLANWLTVIFMVMYWAFRVAVCVNAAQNTAFIATPINLQFEIVMLFVTFFCIILVAKRKMIGGIIYVVMYLAYFGTDLFSTLLPAITNYTINEDVILDSATSILGVVLAVAVIIDLAIDKSKLPDQKQTDWFYGNKKYDRNLDDRADKNNYKLL